MRSIFDYIDITLDDYYSIMSPLIKETGRKHIDCYCAENGLSQNMTLQKIFDEMNMGNTKIEFRGIANEYDELPDMDRFKYYFYFFVYPIAMIAANMMEKETKLMKITDKGDIANEKQS